MRLFTKGRVYITTITVILATVNSSNVYAYEQSLDIQGDSFQGCPVKSTKVLSCPSYHQTTNYTCGPAAVMSVMRYYHKLKPSDFNQRTELSIAKSMNAIPGEDGGTTLSAVAGYLQSQGFSVDSGNNISTDTLISNVKRGIPTIVAFNHHWLVAKGYRLANHETQQSQDEIIFADSCCSMTVISRDSIDNTWQQSHLGQRNCNGGNGDYIIAVPGR